MSRLDFIRREQVRQRGGFVLVAIHCTAQVDGSARIGVEGVGVERDPMTGELESMPQMGGVEIRARARVGALAVVQRGAWADTVIGERSVIGPRATIGHGARIGDDVVVCGGAIICGGAMIGDRATIGAGAIVRPKVIVGQDARVGDGVVVVRDVAMAETLKGGA